MSVSKETARPAFKLNPKLIKPPLRTLATLEETAINASKIHSITLRWIPREANKGPHVLGR